MCSPSRVKYSTRYDLNLDLTGTEGIEPLTFENLAEVFEAALCFEPDAAFHGFHDRIDIRVEGKTVATITQKEVA